MWGELSSECGASCLGASFLWGELSWGELSLGRVVLIPSKLPGNRISGNRYPVSNQKFFRENEAGQAKMRESFITFNAFLVLFLIFFLFGAKLFTIASFLVLIIAYIYKHQDYFQNETRASKTRDKDFADGLKTSVRTDNFILKLADTVNQLNGNHRSTSTVDRWTNSFFDTPSIMWKNQSISFSKESPSKPKARVKLNTTMPLLTTSPMSTRQRKNNLNGSMTTAAGPLLSTPFLPQIKRALGLEPKSQAKYRYGLEN